MSEKLNFRLVQKGDKIIAKADNPNKEFNPKQILDQLNAIDGALSQGRETVTKLKENMKGTLEMIDINEGMLKKFLPYKEWAEKIQRSKVMAIIDENKEAVQKEIEESYNDDKILTKEQNQLQKFMQYQRKLSVHPSIAENINMKIMQDMFYNNCVLDNPFKH